MQDLIARFLRDDRGIAAIEYGLLAAMIAVPVISVAKDVAVAINATFDVVADAMK